MRCNYVLFVISLNSLSFWLSAGLSSALLNEKLNLHGKMGCFLSIIGSTVIIIHAPEEDRIDNLYEIGRNMCTIGEYGNRYKSIYGGHILLTSGWLWGEVI